MRATSRESGGSSRDVAIRDAEAPRMTDTRDCGRAIDSVSSCRIPTQRLRREAL